VEPIGKAAALVSGGPGGAERALLGTTGGAQEEKCRGNDSKGGTLVYTHTTPGDQNGNPSLITRTQVKAIVTAKARLYTRGTVSYMVKESEMEKKQVTVYSNVG
jgi:hypothetical protein